MGTSIVLFDVRGVSKSFGTRVLLSNANLQVFEGETLAIIGESGSGKSVFLKMLMGLVEPDEGEIYFKGECLAELDQPRLDAARRHIGYVFQNDALFDSMVVADNIGYGLREHTKMADDEVRRRAAQCVQMVGLEPRVLDEYPAKLSGGMRKRVALARAIAAKPEVILYDEPTQGLDPQNITRIAEMIEQLQGELHATSVVVTHDLRTAFGVSDRIAMLHDMHFPYQGTPEEFMASEQQPVHEFIDDAREELRELFVGSILSSR